jgi:hypothetical protein
MSFLDKLPINLTFLKNKSTEEFYFALNIDKHQVEAAVWGIIGKKLEIISFAFASYHGTEESLIESSNIALDEALADFQPEPTKVLFGVPEAWLQDDDLKPEHLKVLRRLVKELDVTPLAYVSTTQAISHFVNKQQGVPLTAILVKLTDPLNVTIVKAGKVLGSKDIKRSQNLPQDIERALLTFADVEVLPSKFLIYGDKETDKLKDELQGYSWMAQLPFLHLPKIEFLKLNIPIQATCLAGASELHPDISYTPKSIHTLTPSEQHNRIRTLPPEEDALEASYNTGKAAGAVAASSKAAEMGFAAADLEEESEHPHRGRHPEEDADSAEELEKHPRAVSFRGAHYPEHPPAARHRTEEDHHNNLNGEQQADHHPRHRQERGDYPPSPIQKFMSLVAASPLGMFVKKEERALEHTGWFKKGRLFILPVVLVLLVLGLFIFLPKAKVTVFIDLRVLEKDSQVIADPGATAVDESKKTIPGKVVETQQIGSMKGSASGKKKVGESAKGKIIVYNKTGSPKNLSSGTVLTGPNNLKFTLDTSVQVASQSSTTGADFSTIIKPGKTDAVGSTATEIGPEGNIAAGIELSVAGFGSDQVVAKVDSAFSGGVSRDVTVVTSDDQKKLLASLTSDLKKKASEKVQSELEAGFKVLEEGLSEEIVKRSYTKNVGDQATDFTLNLTINYKGTAYSEGDLKSIVSKLVETNVPEGYELDLSKTETQADVSKLEKDGRIIFLAKFKAKLMPKIDQAKIKQEIAGKTPQEAAERLRQVENVIGSNIELTPSLPIQALQRLPFLSNNITLEVTAK